MKAIVLVVSVAAVTFGSGAEARKLIYLHGRIVQDQQSARPKHPEWGYYELRFAVLGPCMSRSVPALLAEHGRKPTGRILAFREKSDELSEPCIAWSENATDAPLSVREIVLDTGQHHGFLYRPLPEWVEPVVAFANER